MRVCVYMCVRVEERSERVFVCVYAYMGVCVEERSRDSLENSCVLYYHP